MEQMRLTNNPTDKEKAVMLKEQFEKLEEGIEFLVPNDRDWEDIENILEDLQDYRMLNKKGIAFRNFIWKKYIRVLD